MALVVIDPGHGGTTKTGGSSPNNATSPSGLLEKDLTLSVARHAEAALLARGHTVRLTRTSDVNLGLAARAAVAKAMHADVLVSLHFNGFADPLVQGTETWVHRSAAANSHDLAACVQRAVLQVTQYRDRGVQAKVLGVLDPAHFDARTAACLAELSFITTTAEDRHLQDPGYLQALGEAVAEAVEEFISRLAAPQMAVPAVHRSAVLRAGAVAVQVVAPLLVDVRGAIDAIPEKGSKSRFAGPVTSDGDPDSHIQGLAAHQDYFLLTHSDKDAGVGRILVVDRRSGQRKVVAQCPLPRFSSGGAPLFHAGGCQTAGQVLAVPSESGSNTSVIAFFDLTDPLNIRELHTSLRIERRTRDAAAAGLTTITRGGRTSWLCAVYDSGSIDFYESPDVPGGVPFAALFTAPIKVKEKHHQALLLFTDHNNRVVAAGLNKGNVPFFDRLVLYEVDLVGQTMTADPERSYSTGGGTRLRWGSAIEIAGTKLVLHCSDRNYGNSCTIATFDAAASTPASVKSSTRVAQAPGKARKAARTRATKKTAKRRTR